MGGICEGDPRKPADRLHTLVPGLTGSSLPDTSCSEQFSGFPFLPAGRGSASPQRAQPFDDGRRENSAVSFQVFQRTILVIDQTAKSLHI